MKDTQQKMKLSTIYRKYGIIIILVILFIASALINQNFLKPQNLLNILKQISVVTIIACGETMLIVSGMIDLSAGLVCTTSMCFSAGVLVATGSVPLAIVVGILIGMAAGWLNGFMVTQFKLQPFIATLAMTNVAEGIVQLYTNGKSIGGVTKIRFLGQGSIGPIPVPVVIMFAAVAIVAVIMKYTQLGINIYAIGGNEKAAIASGVRVNHEKRKIFTLSGAFVGLAGVVLMARLMAGMPSVGDGYEFDAITAVVVGGTSFLGGIGTVTGALIGSIIVGLINNILNLLHVSTQYQLIVKGVLIAGAVTIDMKTKEDKKSQ
ncbi:MAG: ABC transporter permease [Lachnospiraceae bacterium]|nr:ABC transporter permease [Lachnospiraceae bacterium]